MGPKELKALMIIASYEAALATIGNMDSVDGVTVKPDSLVADLGLQKKNILVYEEAKIHYAAIGRAIADNTVWPDPAPDTVATNAAPAAGTLAAQGLHTAADVASVISKALGAVPTGQTLGASAIAALVSSALGIAGSALTPPPAPGSDIPAPQAPPAK